MKSPNRLTLCARGLLIGFLNVASGLATIASLGFYHPAWFFDGVMWFDRKFIGRQ
jgi:hypothetical protein